MGFICWCSIFCKDREENNVFVSLLDSSLDSFPVLQRPPLINSESIEFQADAAGQNGRHVVSCDTSARSVM